MTQNISSLMDGELEGPEAERTIRACCESEEHKRTWSLYHAIGDAMRGQAPRSLALPAQAFEDTLKAQPTVLAPRARPQGRVARVAMAVAASAATVGVVGWIGSQGGAVPEAPVVAKTDSAPLAQAAVVAAVEPPVAASAVRPVAVTATVRQAVPPLDVEDYLVAHRQMPFPDLYRPVANRTPVVAR